MRNDSSLLIRYLFTYQIKQTNHCHVYDNDGQNPQNKSRLNKIKSEVLARKENGMSGKKKVIPY